jgi:hypothetical protein
VESQLLLPAAYHARQGEATWIALTPIGKLLRSPWRRHIAEMTRRVESQFGIIVRTAAI